MPPPRGFELPPIELVTAYLMTIVAFLFLQLYTIIYSQNERALFFLEQSVGNINYSLENDIRRPYIRFFEKALKAYQRAIPSFCSMNLEKRIRQTELVFRRGTKEDIIKTRDMIDSLANSIKENNPSSFDDGFSELTRFLDKFEKQKEKNGMYKLEIVSQRELWKHMLFTLGWKKDVSILVAILVIAFVVPNAKDIIDVLSRFL